MFGGRYTPPGSVLRDFTEQYDGTSWVTGPALATARRQLSSGRGSDGPSGNDSAIAIGGKSGASPNISAACEEFTGETTAANIVNVTDS